MDTCFSITRGLDKLTAHGSAALTSNYLKDAGENGIIDLFRKAAGSAGRQVLMGIGDDCAVLRYGAELIAVSCDMLVEGVHFLADKITPEQLGWKSLATALSDLAAMGARPIAALMALGLRGGEKKEHLLGLRRGIMRCAKNFGVALVGGDTVLSPECQVLSFTVLGHARRGRLVYRSGARPGHLIAICGHLGDSSAGLSLLLEDEPRLPERARRKLLRAHLRPSPQIDLGLELARGLASAMIDVSDGLLRDLSHICRESGVGAEIDADKVPLSTELIDFSALRGLDPLQFALGGGEDYRLLFCLPESKLRLLGRLRHLRGGRPAVIGKISDKKGIRLTSNGRPMKKPAAGFDHFRERSNR